jgi:acetolactate synthase-1/2/3 large subunit
MDIADLFVAYLEQLGIEYIFGVPGGAIEPLYNAIARSTRRGGLRQILARSESGAAFMADGYARESGKVGVCCATSGPGATNLITGVANAYDNNIPMLVITGQPALPSFGQSPLQESSCTGVNIMSMFRHCTRYNSLISHPKQMEPKLIAALQRATRSPRGPSHLSFPRDLWLAPSPDTVPAYDLSTLLTPSSLVDDDAIEKLREMLAGARNLVLLIGGWCGEAIDSILQFAALKGATFVTTPDGKGLVNARHPLFRGVFGFGGHASAEAALRDDSVDLILAIGANMGEWNTSGFCDSLLNERLVHIDESEDHLARTPMARFHMRGRIASIFNRLIERMHSVQQETRVEVERRRASRELSSIVWDPDSILADPGSYESDAIPIKPQRLMRELSTMFPLNTVFLPDSGNSVAWAVHYLHPLDQRISERRLGGGNRKRTAGRRKSDGGWMRISTEFAPMGWAIGAAVGTVAANPDASVVCITGDGSMLMNGQELSAAVYMRQPIVFVVLNDSALGMVKHGQRLANAERIAFELPKTDFAAMARAMGATAYTIHSAQDLLDLDVAAICDHPGPTLLDVYIDGEEVPPMNARMRILGGNQ